MNTDNTGLIKVTEEFVTPYGTKVWIGIEKPIVRGVDEDSQFETHLRQVRQWGEQATQTSYQNHTISSPPSAIIPEIQVQQPQTRLIDWINGCQSEAELATYFLMSRTNPDNQAAYDKRMKELQGE